MLVLLRVSIGWHFLYQGIWKVQNPGFSSEGFLRQAKGPLAHHFHDLIPDFHGRERLDLENVLGKWQGHRAQFENHYGLSEEQKAAADAVWKQRRQRLEDYFAEIEEAVKEYFLELERYTNSREKSSLLGVAYEKERIWKKGQELQAKVRPWLNEIDAQTAAFHEDLRDLLTDDQRARGPVASEPSQLARVDQLIMLSNLAIGGCLVLGLFTRFASFCGAMFLLSIVAAQPELPFIYPPAPPSAGRAFLVNKEFVEMVAMLVLATTPVGRWGGLDFFIHYLIVRPLFGRKAKA